MDKIISTLTIDDLLIQAAEEASELAQALTKYYRVMHGANPSPVSLQDARDALVEEIADVNVAAEAVRRKMSISCDAIAEVEDAKIERWRRRVENGI
jgi:NTP pyrophosphatase (non-canonical NTP hydrolase)